MCGFETDFLVTYTIICYHMLQNLYANELIIKIINLLITMKLLELDTLIMTNVKMYLTNINQNCILYSITNITNYFTV